MLQLDEDVGVLKEEIQRLEVQRQLFNADTRSRPTKWAVAAEYINRFSHAPSGTSRPLLSRGLPSAQQIFLDSSMDPDVAHHAGFGLSSLVESWELFFQFFNDAEVELEHLERSAADSLIATTTTTVTITDNTLRHAFPRLRDDRSGVRSKLLNQRIVVCGRVQFVWGGADSRIVSVMTQSDLMAPMLRLLGSLEDVSRVFESAFVRPDLCMPAFV